MRSTAMNTPITIKNVALPPAPAAEPILDGPADAGIDRRDFIMRNAVIGAAAVMTGATWTPEARAAQAAKEAAAKPAAQSGKPKLGAGMSDDLNVVKQSKGPVMTVLDEFYKVGPGPSSSHTIGP